MTKKCSKCIYRGYDSNFGGIHCNYIICAGHTRGCDVKECDKFKKGESLTSKSKDFTI